MVSVVSSPLKMKFLKMAYLGPVIVLYSLDLQLTLSSPLPEKDYVVNIDLKKIESSEKRSFKV